MRFRPLPWAQYYYAGTVAFALVDWLAGANVRAVGFAAYPGLRAFYYGVCAFCWWIARFAPAWSGPVTLLESSVNVGTLIVSVLAPYYVFALQGAPEHLASLPELILNFLVSGSAGVVAFYQSLYGWTGLRGAHPSRV